MSIACRAAALIFQILALIALLAKRYRAAFNLQGAATICWILAYIAVTS